MLVRDVMLPEQYCVKEDTSFDKIVRLLVRHNISGVPVIDNDNKIVGFISETDIISHLFPTQREFYQNFEFYLSHEHLETEAVKIVDYTAKKLMTKKVITVSPRDPILKACALLMVHKIRRLPVVEDGNFVGVVNTHNLYKKFLKYLLTVNKKAKKNR